jgi:hypothetical protein
MTRTTIKAMMLGIGLLSAAPLAAGEPAAQAPAHQMHRLDARWRVARPRFGPRRRHSRRGQRRRRFLRGMHRRAMAGYWARRGATRRI